jgi:EAL domain-containing protein (putative c-di-GMP-specific phosphodiesterase class I)
VQRLKPEEERGDTAESMLGLLVQLGHMLGLSVTAEGIETPSQARRLTANGCDLGQGWQFGRPSDPDQISKLLLARR